MHILIITLSILAFVAFIYLHQATKARYVTIDLMSDSVLATSIHTAYSPFGTIDTIILVLVFLSMVSVILSVEADILRGSLLIARFFLYIVLVLLIIALLIIYSVFVHIRNNRKHASDTNISLHIPQKIYEGDSRIIVLQIINWRPLVKFYSPDLSNSNNGNQNSNVDCIEVELLAAGFIVDGDKKQKRKIKDGPLTYQWDISCPKSGDHEIGLVLRVYDLTGRELGIYTIKRRIKVAKLDHMTARQVLVMKYVFGVLSFILALLEALVKIGIF